jgi:host factor-I protein
MENKTQNIQDVYLNTVRKEKQPVTIFLMSGVKLMGRLKGFDKYSVILEANHQEQLIFKHAISTVTTSRPGVGRPPRDSAPRDSVPRDSAPRDSAPRDSAPREPKPAES